MDASTTLALVLVIGAAATSFVYRRLRLRRAVSVLRRQIAWSMRHAPRGKLVLDVGSGDNPHLRADVLCEKYLHDDLFRGSGVALDRPLVAGDAAALPFRTGAFDVIIASHLVGHLPDPQSFFDEAGRVADSGLFIAPSALHEQLRSIPTHLWLVEQTGSAFHFTAKDRPICYPVIHEFFMNKVMDTRSKVDDFELDHWDSLINTYTWAGHPECVVEGEPSVSEFVGASTLAAEAVVPEHILTGLQRLRLFLKRWVRNALHAILSSHREVDWADVLACPRCHGYVTVSTKDVYCPSCRLRFPVYQGIPIMLLDHAVGDPHAEPAGR